MSKFQRESKYWVVKRTDLEKHLDPDTCCQVEEALIHVDASRLRSGKKSLQGVFIRDTSPFYDEAWALVEKEVAERVEAPNDPIQKAMPMLCPHGQGLTDYCQPCGRVSGGGP